MWKAYFGVEENFKLSPRHDLGLGLGSSTLSENLQAAEQVGQQREAARGGGRASPPLCLLPTSALCRRPVQGAKIMNGSFPLPAPPRLSLAPRHPPRAAVSYYHKS